MAFMSEMQIGASRIRGLFPSVRSEIGLLCSTPVVMAVQLLMCFFRTGRKLSHILSTKAWGALLFSSWLVMRLPSPSKRFTHVKYSHNARIITACVFFTVIYTIAAWKQSVGKVLEGNCDIIWKLSWGIMVGPWGVVVGDRQEGYPRGLRF